MERTSHLNERLRRHLRKAGLALIVFGCVDSVACVLRVARDFGTTAGVGIFAIVAGVLVYRESQKAARLSVIGASFFLGGLLALPVSFPLTYPLRLLWLKARLAPGEAVVAALVMALALATCVAVLYWLTRVPLGKVRGFSPRAYRTIAAAVGAALSLVSAIVFSVWIDDSGPFRRAIAEARAQVGPGYSFRVQTLNAKDGRGRAKVVAYTDTELRTVTVRWGEE